MVLRTAREFQEAAKSLSDPLQGDIHLGLIPTLAPYLLPHIMRDLGDVLPKIDFFLHENQTHVLLGALDRGEMDAAILSWLPDMTDFEMYRLFDEPMLLAVSDQHALGEKNGLTLQDLRGQQVLTLEDGHCSAVKKLSCSPCTGGLAWGAT